ncbi:MAG TPA: hypothetical protein VFG13_11275 [Blastococcus sp.]|nr:hypothetical protein [Blastococcus sp.]
MGGADTERLDAVDIKVTLAGDDLPRARSTFGLTEPAARRSRLYFCECPADGRRSTLLDAGVVLRLQESDDEREAALVLRPCWPARLTRRWIRRSPGSPRIRVAGDWRPHHRMVAASAAAPVSARALQAALTHPNRLRDAFSAEQRVMLAEAGPPRLSWDTLRVFGPVELCSWERTVDELALRATLWTVRPAEPDLLELLELLVTARAPDAGLVLPTLVGQVRGCGLDPDAFPGTKTRRVLAELAGAASREPG